MPQVTTMLPIFVGIPLSLEIDFPKIGATAMSHLLGRFHRHSVSMGFSTLQSLQFSPAVEVFMTLGLQIAEAPNNPPWAALTGRQHTPPKLAVFFGRPPTSFNLILWIYINLHGFI